MTEGRRKRSTSVWHRATPPPLPRPWPLGLPRTRDGSRPTTTDRHRHRHRRRRPARDLAIHQAGSQFYILTMGLAGTWAIGALSSGPLPLNITATSVLSASSAAPPAASW